MALIVEMELSCDRPGADSGTPMQGHQTNRTNVALTVTQWHLSRVFQRMGLAKRDLSPAEA
eukprot:4833178-Amphidinium_carterae.1